MIGPIDFYTSIEQERIKDTCNNYEKIYDMIKNKKADCIEFKDFTKFMVHKVNYPTTSIYAAKIKFLNDELNETVCDEYIKNLKQYLENKIKIHNIVPGYYIEAKLNQTILYFDKNIHLLNIDPNNDSPELFNVELFTDKNSINTIYVLTKFNSYNIKSIPYSIDYKCAGNLMLHSFIS
jgi:hypothetical protein